jgi:ABC-type sugar transport system ATPase subunit
MGLSLQGVDKYVGREMYLESIDLELASGSRNVLLGRTRAGKTTLLRIMAGLDRPTKGRVLIDDRDVTGLSVRKRNVAMVYQQFINYPSLSVYNNIAACKKPPKCSISGIISNACRPSCPEASSSARPSPAPWSRTPSCY